MRQNRAVAFKQKKELIVKLQGEIADLSRKVTIKPHATATQGGKSSFYLQQLLNITSERAIPQGVGVNQSFFLPSSQRHLDELYPRRGRSRSNPKLQKSSTFDPTTNILSELDCEPMQKHRSVQSPMTPHSFGQASPFGPSSAAINGGGSFGKAQTPTKEQPQGPQTKPFVLDQPMGNNGSAVHLQPMSATAAPAVGDYSGIGSRAPDKKEPAPGPPKPKQPQPGEDDSVVGKISKWFSNTFS